jgi:hypothetical protein
MTRRVHEPTVFHQDMNPLSSSLEASGLTRRVHEPTVFLTGGEWFDQTRARTHSLPHWRRALYPLHHRYGFTN